MSEHNRLIEKCLQLQNENKLLKHHKSELIGTLSMALDSKRRKLYLKELNETLNKYTPGNK